MRRPPNENSFHSRVPGGKTKASGSRASMAAPEGSRIQRRLAAPSDHSGYCGENDRLPARISVLVPAGGERGLAVAEAPGGRYELPSRNDCLACHDGAAVPVLGFGALQLSTDRDAGAAHAVAADPGDLDLRKLAERGLLRGLPRSLRESPPRIAAATATERAALGYLHGNCGACHNDDGAPAPVRLVLAQRVADAAASRHRMLQTTVGVTARLQPAAAAPPVQRIAPGLPDDSLLLQRMRSRHAALQMPPLGTAQPDPEGLALIERWIANDLTHPKEH